LSSAPHLDVFGDISAACDALANKDKALARALEAIERPYIRHRRGGFEALFRIIVEQQVSVASAQAIWARCRETVKPMRPHSAIALGTDGLRSCGLTGAKAGYVFGLAEMIDEGALDLKRLPALDDMAAAQALRSVKGIGPWTAAIYLLFCEGRVDIWPPGDVALLGAYKTARLRGPKPDMARMDANAKKWAPYRGVAAHILWTYYAHIRGRTPI
jgi:DNA-3-methyladenine glycosylase II